MARKAVSSDQAPEALGPCSHAIVAGNLVFCSGMAGIDPVTGEAAAGIEAQTEQALLNLAAVLRWRPIAATPALEMRDSAAGLLRLL